MGSTWSLRDVRRPWAAAMPGAGAVRIRRVRRRCSDGACRARPMAPTIFRPPNHARRQIRGRADHMRQRHPAQRPSPSPARSMGAGRAPHRPNPNGTSDRAKARRARVSEVIVTPRASPTTTRMIHLDDQIRAVATAAASGSCQCRDFSGIDF